MLRIYRALMRLLLPVSFSDAFGDELVAVFAEVVREARARGGRTAALRTLAAEVPGLVRLAVNERRTHHTRRPRIAATRLEENMFDSLRQDLVFAARSLRRAPVFTCVAVLTLALGIGANTAIFSVVNSVLLTPLHLAKPNQLVAIGEEAKSASATSISVTSPGSLFDWKSAAKSMDIGAYTTANRTLTGQGDPQMLAGSIVVGGLMDVLGVQPMFGRRLTTADEDPAASPVVVLSFEAWHRLFGDDRRVLGRVLMLNGTASSVVGVMPPGFTFPAAPNDFWLPAQFSAAFRGNRDQYFLSAVGRLKHGATIDQARTEMNTIMDRLTRDWPKYNQGNRIGVTPLQESIVGSVRNQLTVLMGAVAVVLLITCANIGNLLLARAAARRREIAVRQALGAATTRIARQLLTESLLLAVAGGLAGVLVGKAFLELLLAAQVTTNLPRADEITLDVRVLLFTLGISLIAGVLFGSIPAWQLARRRSAEVLRDGTRGSAGHQWTRSALVVSELALALMLLTGAGLLLRSFSLMQRVQPGVNAEHVLTFSINRSARDATFYPAALERIRAIPGVRAAALTSTLPISGRGTGAWFNRIDRPLPDNVQPTGAPYRVVTPDYFGTVGIPLVAGRLLDASDRKEAPAIVVNQALVKKYYPGENPIGKPVYLGAPDNRLFDSAPIVGIVADTHDAGLGTDPIPTVYIPLQVMPTWPFFSFAIRTAGDPAAVIASARQAIHELDPTIPIRNERMLSDIVADAVAPARWSATLLGVFAAVALVTAVLGVFGVLSFIVTQRTRELGIRIALGASSAAVRRMVVGRGLALVGLGLAVGFVGARALTRFMTSLLYGVTPTDPWTFAGVAAVLALSGAAASYFPARRATHVDPIIALRAE